MNIVETFFHKTRGLKQAEIDGLLRQGISAAALAADPCKWGFAIGAADVIFEGNSFDYADEFEQAGRPALLVLARGEDGEPVDIVAARPRENAVASWAGRAALLGQQNLFAARFGEPLHVHRDILGWLRNERRGVLIVHLASARRLLAEAGPLQADTVEDGLELEQLLSYRPTIVVPSQAREAA